MSENINFVETIKRTKIFPIIRTSDPEQAIEVARALAEGGIKIIEMNIRQERYSYSFHVAVHIFFLKYDGQYSSLYPMEVARRQESIKQGVHKK